MGPNLSAGSAPTSALARAAASFTMARARTSSGKCLSVIPDIWKFSRARAVCTPK